MGVVVSLIIENITKHLNYLTAIILNNIWLCTSNWTDYHDAINYRESKYYCMISNGSFINISKPYDINKEYGDECVIVKLTNDNEA